MFRKRDSFKRVLRNMGYLPDQQGIIDRYIRERGGWDPHLARCREYILKKVRERMPDTVTILGSGWLLDVPLEELLSITGHVNLVDINHPPHVKHNVSRFQNVSLLSEDITGGLIRMVWDWNRRMEKSPDELEVPLYKPSYETGMVISLNILTQTDTLLIDFIAEISDYEREIYRALRRKIQDSHIEFIRSSGGILISDTEEIVMDKGSEFSRSDLVFGDLSFARKEEEWEWDFDNSGEYYRRKSVIFKVGAYDFKA